MAIGLRMIFLRLFYALAALAIMGGCQLRSPGPAHNTDAATKEKKDDSLQDSNLFIGVRNNDAAAVKRALLAGANVNAKDRSGFTPLMIAAIKGDLEVVQILLDAGANPNATDETGETALIDAIESGNNKILSLLLDKGADVFLRAKYQGETALHVAANREDATALKILLARKVDVNVRDNSGNTPLIVAAAGNTEALQALLDHGADVNLTNETGSTALMSAVSSHRNLRLLLEHGANVNARNRDGWTVLEGALLHGCPATVATLEAAGAKE